MGKSQGVEIKLGKQKRYLLLTTDSLARYEEVTGKKLMAQSTAKNFSLWDVIVVVWSLLLHEDPNLEVRDVGNMIDPANMGPLMNAVAKAIENYTEEIQR
jgi:hypothetical protein